MPKHGSSSNRPVELERIVEQLLDDLQRAAQEVTPAFIRTMPNAYFHDTTHHTPDASCPH